MSDKYRKVDYYKCEECGKAYDHPSLAENCWFTDKMLAALEQAENHIELSRSKMFEEIKERVSEGEYDLKRYKVTSHFGESTKVLAMSEQEALDKAAVNRPEVVEEIERKT